MLHLSTWDQAESKLRLQNLNSKSAFETLLTPAAIHSRLTETQLERDFFSKKALEIFKVKSSIEISIKISIASSMLLERKFERLEIESNWKWEWSAVRQCWRVKKQNMKIIRIFQDP